MHISLVAGELLLVEFLLSRERSCVCDMTVRSVYYFFTFKNNNSPKVYKNVCINLATSYGPPPCVYTYTVFDVFIKYIIFMLLVHHVI